MDHLPQQVLAAQFLSQQVLAAQFLAQAVLAALLQAVQALHVFLVNHAKVAPVQALLQLSRQ